MNDIDTMRKRMELPPSETARAASHWRDEFGPKACEHDYDFLRNCAVYEDPAVTTGARARETGRVDVFYCRRCLEYREVKR